MITSANITPLTREEKIELANLTSEAEISNGSYGAESTRRTALTFKSNANRFKELIEDDIEETEETAANYELQAVKQWNAYLANS